MKKFNKWFVKNKNNLIIFAIYILAYTGGLYFVYVFKRYFIKEDKK